MRTSDRCHWCGNPLLFRGADDLLTAHNGSTISYDAIGNPLSDANRSFTWEHGRQMATQTRGDTTWTYTYDTNGMRTSRSNGTKTYEYVYSGDKLVQMTVTDISANTEQLIEFSYDAVGQPLTMTLDGTVYYYLLNIQGDVMGLVDGSGNLLVSYLYEAYGECFYITDTSDMVNTLIGANPLLYRSYLIDTGTGLYYLQSRYYDPQLGRFINADGLVSTGQGILGNNMFAYCGNNPVHRVDPSGDFWLEALIVLAVVVCAVILSGCSSQPVSNQPRSDLANAPDLNVYTASPTSYNCYGNGIGKQISTDPTGYTPGDSTQETFEAVKMDLGSDNVRKLDSIDDPIGEDEFKVAMKCGPSDYHFIRLTPDGWYNKSGDVFEGLFVGQNIVTANIWCAMFTYDGQVLTGFPVYNDETIYFAVKTGWDKQ